MPEHSYTRRDEDQFDGTRQSLRDQDRIGPFSGGARASDRFRSLFDQLSKSIDARGRITRLFSGTKGVAVRDILTRPTVNLGGQTEITLDTNGEVTVSRTRHTIDTFEDGATDDCITISGGSDGDLLILSSANSARDTTLKDTTGNMLLAGDFTLSTAHDQIMLVHHNSGAFANKWVELSRSDNN